MREIRIGPNEAGQRLDKFLHKYLKEAPSSFLYKMMRKKNILLNGGKCEGRELLAQADAVKLFLAEETLEKFGAPPKACQEAQGERLGLQPCLQAYGRIGPLPIVYEDGHILAVNKPAGLLTQKADPGDLSLNEWLIGYLLDTGALTEQALSTFRPSVCNRLDRNTSGLVLCAKSLAGAQALSEALRTRALHKYYRLFVKGWPEAAGCLEGWLVKDAKTNQVRVFEGREALGGRAQGGQAAHIRTGLSPLLRLRLPEGQPVCYAEVELFTGKTHQIRAHLAQLGHPLLGDPKYGDAALNRRLEKLGIRHQLLHAGRLTFPPQEAGPLAALSGKTLSAPEPEGFWRLRAACTILEEE